MEQPLRGDRRQKFPRNSSLKSLSPFVDEQNKVIRVWGLLVNSPYTIDWKFQVLIARKSPITEMLIREAHEKNLHGGPQLTLYRLRRFIWIPGGLPVVKGVLYRCKRCIQFDAKLLQPQMGDLPRERVVPSFAFEHCGLDYCGPFYTKNGTRTFLKTYVAVFICFSTKAVHREPVMSLTKDDCLAAIKRFVSRRGIPDEIYSDNSTTFIGTKGELVSTSLSYSRVWKFDINIRQGEQDNLAYYSAENIKIWRTMGGRCQILETPHVPQHWKNKTVFWRLHNTVDTNWSNLKFKAYYLRFKWSQWCLSTYTLARTIFNRTTSQHCLNQKQQEKNFLDTAEEEDGPSHQRLLEEVVNRIFVEFTTMEKMANGTNKYWHQWCSNNQGRERTTHSVANRTNNKGLWWNGKIVRVV